MTQVSNKKPVTGGTGYISYFIYEGEQARMERINCRMFVLVLILLVSLILSNLYWLMR